MFVGVVRVGWGLALLASAWMGADGLRRADAGLASARIPWDANRLPEDAPDSRLLALRPVSPFARFRDALARADGPDGDAFRTAARGARRWARNQAGLLLDLGRVAMTRWKGRGEGGDREVGEALLAEYVNRATNDETSGVGVWLEFATAKDDPWPVFRGARADLWQPVAYTLAATHPTAAWRFLEPDLRAGVLDPRYAGAVLSLATVRRNPSDAPLLRSLAKRADVDPPTARALLDLARTLAGER